MVVKGSSLSTRKGDTGTRQARVEMRREERCVKKLIYRRPNLLHTETLVSSLTIATTSSVCEEE
jgi:hypothetical protein